MLLPIGTELPRSRAPYATIALIVATTIISAGLWANGIHELRNDEAIRFDNVHFVWKASEWWRLFSYQFAHADVLHLIGNMIFLWVFGPPLEDKLGRAGMALVYLLGGAGAAAAHAMVSRNPVIGASGSVATLAGVFVVLFPLIEIRVLLWFFIIGIYNISARWFVLFCVIKDLIMPGHNVAWMAHLGGYGLGFAVGGILLVTKIVPRDQFDLVALYQRMRRRAAFRAVASGHGSSAADAGVVAAVARPFRGELKDALGETHARAATLRASVSARIAEGNWKQAGLEYCELTSLKGLAPAVRALPRDKQMELCSGLMQAGEYQAARVAFIAFGAAYPHEPDTFAATMMGAMVQIRHLGEAAAAKTLLLAARKQDLDSEQIAMIDSLVAEADASMAGT